MLVGSSDGENFEAMGVNVEVFGDRLTAQNAPSRRTPPESLFQSQNRAIIHELTDRWSLRRYSS
jgi:hypothetical protein